MRSDLCELSRHRQEPDYSIHRLFSLCRGRDSARCSLNDMLAFRALVIDDEMPQHMVNFLVM